LLGPNRPDVPPVIPRYKSSAREAAGSTVDIDKGKIDEDEVSSEEEEG